MSPQPYRYIFCAVPTQKPQTMYSEFQLRSNLRVAFASVQNRVCTLVHVPAGAKNVISEVKVHVIHIYTRFRTQHGDLNATEIRCTCSYTHPEKMSYRLGRNLFSEMEECQEYKPSTGAQKILRILSSAS